MLFETNNIQRQNSDLSNKFSSLYLKSVNKNKKVLKEMSEKIRRGESLKPIKKSPSPKKVIINSICKKFKTNPGKFYSEIPALHALKYELKLEKDNEIISKYFVNL